MRSRASFKSHPVHPRLVTYPFAFLTGGSGFGMAGAIWRRDELKTVSGYLDRCTHKGGLLSDGVLICSVVQCPWHGSQFDVETGAVKCRPAEEEIRRYEIEPAHVPVKSA